MTYEPPAIVEREEVGGPVIRVNPVGSPPITSPAWRRTDDDRAATDD